MKVFITGTSGVGKTTLIDELARRSYVAFNTDDIPGATRLEIKATGQAVEWPTGYVDWQKYAWNWQDAKLKELLSSADLVFIGAIVGNWTVYASLFDKIFVLTVDDDILNKRLSNLERHEHQQDPANIKKMIEMNQLKQKQFIDAGAIPLDANQPVEKIADDLIEALQAAEHELLSAD